MSEGSPALSDADLAWATVDELMAKVASLIQRAVSADVERDAALADAARERETVALLREAVDAAEGIIRQLGSERDRERERADQLADELDDARCDGRTVVRENDRLVARVKVLEDAVDQLARLAGLGYQTAEAAKIMVALRGAGEESGDGRHL